MKMKRLDTKEKERLRHSICVEVADFLKRKRLGKNYSITSVAEYLGMSKSKVDRYESGVSIPLDVLPLFSVCYDFPMSEYFEKTSCTDIVDSFKAAVDVQIQKRYKVVKDGAVRPEKKLTARVYEVDGKVVTEQVVQRERRLSFADSCRQGMYETDGTAFRDEEFHDYIRNEFSDKSELILTVGKLLKLTDYEPGKDTLCGYLSKTVIDDIIIKPLVKEPHNNNAIRAYLYYKKMLLNKS